MNVGLMNYSFHRVLQRGVDLSIYTPYQRAGSSYRVSKPAQVLGPPRFHDVNPE